MNHMIKQQNSRSGFIRLVVLAVVIIALLAYFKIDLRALGDKPIVQKFFQIFIVAWGTYIKPLFVYLWTSITAIFK